MALGNYMWLCGQHLPPHDALSLLYEPWSQRIGPIFRELRVAESFLWTPLREYSSERFQQAVELLTGLAYLAEPFRWHTQPPYMLAFQLILVKPAMLWLAKRTGSIENGPSMTFMTATILMTTAF